MSTATNNLSWWHQTSRLSPPSPIQRLPRSVDVAIVGAGMMGASLAYWLTGHGLEPLVLERGHPASAASGQNGGLVVVGASDEYVELAAVLGDEAAAELVRGSIENHALMQALLEQEGATDAWSPCGFVDLWTSQGYRQASIDSAQAMNALGWETQLLDRAGCERAMGTRLDPRVLGGAWTPRDSSVQPVSYVYALARAAQRGGASLAYDNPAVRLEPTSRGWTIATANAEVQARQVVLAANVATAELLPESAPLFRYVRDTVIVTAPAEPPLRVGWNEDGVTPYGRPLEDGRLVFGGFASERFGPPPSDQTSRLRVRERVRNRHPRWNVGLETWDQGLLQERLAAYLDVTFPDYRDLALEYVWSGTLGISRDRLPVVGPWPSAERLWLLTGFGGQGLPFSQWAPRLLAEAIASSNPSHIPWYLSPQRFFEGP